MQLHLPGGIIALSVGHLTCDREPVGLIRGQASLRNIVGKLFTPMWLFHQEV